MLAETSLSQNERHFTDTVSLKTSAVKLWLISFLCIEIHGTKKAFPSPPFKAPWALKCHSPDSYILHTHFLHRKRIERPLRCSLPQPRVGLQPGLLGPSRAALAFPAEQCTWLGPGGICNWGDWGQSNAFRFFLLSDTPTQGSRVGAHKCSLEMSC